MPLIFDEQFEAAGYDESAAGVGSDWVETGNGTIDEDFAVSSVAGAPARWGDQCLKIIPGSTGATIINQLDTSITGDFYCRVDVIFANLTADDYNNFFIVRDDVGNDAIKWVHTQSGASKVIQAFIDGANPIPSHGYSINFDTPYRLDMFYNATTNAWEIKIEGVSQCTGSNNTRANIDSIWCYSYDGYTSDIAYFDLVQIATDGWVPDDTTTYTRTLSLDSYLKKIYNKTLSIDGLLNKIGTAQTSSFDGVLLGLILKTLSLDGLLNKVGLTKISSLDSLLQKLGATGSTSLDSLLYKIFEKTLGVDAYLQRSSYSETDIDGLLQKLGLTQTVSLDAVLIALVGYVGMAWGEETPDEDEEPESWQAWEISAGVKGYVSGDQDWGKLWVESGSTYKSSGKDTGERGNKRFTVARDKYGTGSGNVTIETRGTASSFLQHDVSPAWQEYTGPV